MSVVPHQWGMEICKEAGTYVIFRSVGNGGLVAIRVNRCQRLGVQRACWSAGSPAGEGETSPRPRDPPPSSCVFFRFRKVFPGPAHRPPSVVRKKNHPGSFNLCHWSLGDLATSPDAVMDWPLKTGRRRGHPLFFLFSFSDHCIQPPVPECGGEIGAQIT
jgi:hypothetical protein